jgi:hypothetical protein
MLRTRKDACVIALVGFLASIVVALAVPTHSQAWAWKDTCIADVYNASGGTARMVFWTPVLPIPSNLQMLPIYIAVGMPSGTALGMLTQNTGTPVSWGCHGTLSYASPLGVAACGYSAPTKGANSFDCTGLYGLRWQTNDDNIYVHVGLPITPPGAAGAEAPDRDDDTTPASALTATATRAMLDDGDLTGAWKTTNDLASTGAIGAAWAAGTESPSCQRDPKDGDVPGHAGQWLVGSDGDVAGSAVADFATVREANATYDSAFSESSINCLAGLLRSGVAANGGTATATVSRLDRPDLGRESDAYRIDLGTAGTLDVLGVRTGETFALTLFSSSDGDPSTAQENAAQAAVADRLDD